MVAAPDRAVEAGPHGGPGAAAAEWSVRTDHAERRSDFPGDRHGPARPRGAAPAGFRPPVGSAAGRARPLGTPAAILRGAVSADDGCGAGAADRMREYRESTSR